jgi:peptidoglycan/xylan/chitin deacetylase (PgdA/CDA1 family)
VRPPPLARGLVCGGVLALSACSTLPASLPTSARAPAFESRDFVVVFAKPGDTPRSLAAAHLGDPAKAWMIEDYNDTSSLLPGQEVVIPKGEWNPAAVSPAGYQLVPVLVYHGLAPQARGRLVLAARAFAEQMRYLKAQGYRVVRLRDLVEFVALHRQLPRRSVVLTFDDGYKSFLLYARPVLKELGFPATLFVYTDYVGSSRNALGWDDLRRLAGEGFEIEAHSKSHEDLRRGAIESSEQYARRMQAELRDPLAAFKRQLGQSPRVLAYPYGESNAALLQFVREAGYVAAFSVRREANPSYADPLVLSRSQVYSDMTLEDFAANLTVFHPEEIR